MNDLSLGGIFVVTLNRFLTTSTNADGPKPDTIKREGNAKMKSNNSPPISTLGNPTVLR